MEAKEIFGPSFVGWGGRHYFSWPVDLYDLEFEERDKINETLTDDDFIACFTGKVEYIYRQEDDPRRGYEVCIISFENKPVSILQRAGRELDDHQFEYVIDPILKQRMCKMFYVNVRKALNHLPISVFENNRNWLYNTMNDTHSTMVTNLDEKKKCYVEFYGLEFDFDTNKWINDNHVIYW